MVNLKQILEEETRKVAQRQEKTARDIQNRSPQPKTPPQSSASKNSKSPANGSSSQGRSSRRKSSTPKKRIDIDVEEATADVKQRTDEKVSKFTQQRRAHSVVRERKQSQTRTGTTNTTRGQNALKNEPAKKSPNLMNSLTTIIACSLGFGVLFFSLTHIIVDPSSRNALTPPYQTVHNALPVAIVNSMGADGVVNLLIGLFVGAVVGFFAY